MNEEEVEERPELSLSERRVFEWRVREFGRMGFGTVDAELLAASDADLDGARKIRSKGCPLELLFRIVA